MLYFSPFRSPSQQRRAVLGATEFEPLPLHPSVQQQLEKAKEIDERRQESISSHWGLFLRVVFELKGLVLELVAWTILSSLAVLGSVFVVQRIFSATPGVRSGLSLGALYLLFKGTQALLEYQIVNRRLQIHRGAQLVLFRITNEKLAQIAPAGRANFSSGQLKTLIGSDVESIEDFISAALMQWTPALVSTIIIAPALWFVSGFAGICGLATALAVIPIAALGATFIEQLQLRAQAQQDRLLTRVGEWVKNIRLVRFLGWEQAIERDINERMWGYIWRDALRHGVAICVWAITYSWSMSPIIVICAVSLASGESFNLVKIFASLWLLDYLMYQIQNIPYSLSLYGSACAGARRVIELLKQPNLSDYFKPGPSEDLSPSSYPTKLIVNDLGVDFGDTTALSNLTITFDLTQRTAIVGSVASGKTTLLDCLIGELPPTKGTVLVEFSNGTKGDLWNPEIYSAYRRNIAYSPQQPFLSNAAMRDNIDLSSNCSLEDLQSAIALSELSEDLVLFRRGLDEEVGESGINLSGGQRQRVSLARAFLSKRSILVLDDPLSAVDPRTEKALMDSILAKSRGVILVSHRLIELERCDRVIVMERGVVVEDGEPKLLAKDEKTHFSAFLRAVLLNNEEDNLG
jgi:ABC-type multidrug transport system fused ATPase/permease subunit